MVRVRFAPSPTGHLHIGGARTALFNWLFARHSNGVFILRIEDTDIKRSKESYLEQILASLKWLGLDWDEGPYFQSKRLAIYEKYAQKLIKEGKAYYVESAQPAGTGSDNIKQAVKFRLPPVKIKIDDLIHGEIEFDNQLLDDLVIMKRGWLPTYNFACAVDDIEMEITHVVRGDDHISNTPKQVALYQALGIREPQFAHIPLILSEDRARLSKRRGAQSITAYREEGYLPEAMVNYLALLSWSPGGNREFIDIKGLVKEFTLKRVNKTGAVFDIDKLDWMNAQYIKRADIRRLTDHIALLLVEQGFINKDYNRKWLEDVVKLFQGRMKRLGDFSELAGFYFSKRIKYDNQAVDKFLKREGVSLILKRLVKALEDIESFDTETIEIRLRALAQELGISGGDLIHPTRVALTGKSVSPGLFEMIALLGKEKTIKRLRQVIRKL